MEECKSKVNKKIDPDSKSGVFICQNFSIRGFLVVCLLEGLLLCNQAQIISCHKFSFTCLAKMFNPDLKRGV